VTYYNWQKPSKADYIKFRKASPNLVELKDVLIKVYGGTSVGIYNRRPVRGGTSPSSHSFGAALDWRYTNRKHAVQAMDWMVKEHAKLGVQMIVDYVGLRIWTLAHGWKKQKPNSHGMGQEWAKWLHIETTKDSWGTKTPIDNRP
jgi:hypothetical protein